jgi:outer membrane protein assembly factor BamB
VDYRIRWQQQRRQRRRKRLFIIPAALALASVLYLLLRNVGGAAAYWEYRSPERLTPHFAVTPSLLLVAWANGHVTALRTADGQPTTSGPLFSVPEAFNTTPTAVQRVLYLGSDSGVLRAVDARAGHLLWSHDTGAPLRCQPLVTGGHVYVGNGDGMVYCFLPGGTKVWARQLDDGVSGAPALVGPHLVVATTRGAVHGLDAATGKPVWRRDLRSRDEPTPCFGPVTAAPPFVLVGSDLGYLYMLQAATGKPAHQPYYTGGLIRGPAAVDDQIIAFGSTDGWLRVISREAQKPLWAHRVGSAVVAGPVIARGVIYVASATRLLALDATSGRLLRTWRGEQFAGDLVVTTDTIYLGTNLGVIRALPTP